jgi:septation ring formation regulator EzrA
MDAKKEKYLKDSKDRLLKIAIKKIQTTMIGALSAFEEKFRSTIERSPEFRELYNEARQRILDNGNHQIRNLETELEQYTVEWNRYQYILPVKPLGGIYGSRGSENK